MCSPIVSVKFIFSCSTCSTTPVESEEQNTCIIVLMNFMIKVIFLRNGIRVCMNKKDLFFPFLERILLSNLLLFYLFIPSPSSLALPLLVFYLFIYLFYILLLLFFVLIFVDRIFVIK